MSEQYQIKQVKTNQRGHKVVTTVSTDDPEVAKSLIGTAASTQSTSSKKKTAKSSTASKSKKEVVIDAEFTEVKSKKVAKPSKTTSKRSKKTVAKPKALPSPAVKKKESKPKQATKKTSEPKTSSSKKSIVKFEVGKIYYARFATQSDTIIKVKIVARTEKTIKWVNLRPYQKPEVKTSRPSIYEGVEQFYPTGRYSMAPIISADWIYGVSKY